MKITSHRLGHAMVSTTDEIYSHLPRVLKKASQQFSELMKDLIIFNDDHTQSNTISDQKYDL